MPDTTNQAVNQIVPNGQAVSGGGDLYHALYGHPTDTPQQPVNAPQGAVQGQGQAQVPQQPQDSLSGAYEQAMQAADQQVADARAAAQAPIIARQQEADRRANLAAQDPTNEQPLLKHRKGSSPGSVTLAISPSGRALQGLSYGAMRDVAPEHPLTYWEKHPEVQNTDVAPSPSPQFQTLLDRKLAKVRADVLQRLEAKHKK